MRLSPAPGLVTTGAMAIAVLAACARMQPPPGGPPDNTPPRLLSVRPDSGAVLPKFDGEVEFTFDEVISEGGAPSQGLGTSDLERLVMLSPSTRVPKIRWRRNRLTVAPAEGWQPNRVYRVQLLPGVTDLRRNRGDSGVVVTFTTGAPAPSTTLTGVVVDWTTRRPVPSALVEALLLPDSLPYRTLTDSSGKFVLGPLPHGNYVVFGVVDQNRDQRLSSREAYDSVRLATAATDAGELWTFVHDSAPPHIDAVTINDSLSLMIKFSQMLDPTQPIPLSSVQLSRLPDSAAVAITSLLPEAADDSLHRPPADTARRDTVIVPPAPVRGAGHPAELTSRPRLFDQLILRVPMPWQPGDRFLVKIRGVRNVTGTVGDVRAPVAVPPRKPALPDSLKLPVNLPTPPKPR